MRKKSTKLLALLTAGITAASLLAGCGSGGSDNAGTTDQAQESETKTEDTASTDGG
ncbi:MAG: carbohydrate ABC transporter substrate-binding protein, partial [Lachnospiraceae bacterium]|nr:carbohydrate ABC transporter substrate-binding protein [Lachnospiraceae bacterium]